MAKYSSDFQKRWFKSKDSKAYEEFVAHFLDPLSEEQAEVAMHKDGPLLVVAGPGSGKTTTMVHRTAILIDHHNIDPAKILVTTFTEKAAESITNKIKERIKNPYKVESLTIGTIHGVCLKILEDFGVQNGMFSRSLRVLDEHRASLFLFNNFKSLGLNDFYDRPQAKNISAMLSFYSSFQEKGTDVSALKALIKKDKDFDDDDVVAALETYPKYLDLLKENQALDFSSILSRTYELLSDNKDVLKAVREKYDYLIVDEYQDTNPIQDQILRLIAEPKNNIVVIGDDDQCLYRFRGATVTNFLNFSSRVAGCKTTNLTENRRSTPEILNLSRAVVKNIPAEGRTEKVLKTNNLAGHPVVATSFDTDEDEVAGIAATIQDLYNNKKIDSYGDIAILCYSLSSIFGILKQELDARGIPFISKGDKSFNGQAAITQIVDIMTFLTRRKGSATDLSFLKPPVFHFLDAETEAELGKYKFESDVVEEIKSASDLKIKSPYDKGRVFALVELRRRILESSYSKKLYSDLLDLFFQVLKVSDTIKFLSLDPNKEESDEVLTQLGMFSQLLSDYSNETQKRSFSDFREFFNWIIKGTLDNPDSSINENAVVIQTIHQAKGLEYPVVFMPGLVDSRFPSRRPDDSGRIPFAPKVHRFWNAALDCENTDTDFRRILYVGITRAERLLYLSYFRRKSKKVAPSRYITELVNESGLVIAEENSIPKLAIDRKRRHGENKLRLSSSHLQYYLFCPTRFKYALEHSIAAPHRGYFSFGSNLHSAIEEASNIVRTKGSAALRVKDANVIFERHWNSFGFDRIGAEEKQKEVARAYFSNFVEKQTPLLESIVVSEKKFVLEEDNFILTGKIDAISQLNDGTLKVIDFKTGKKDKFEKEPESTFVNHQANIYVEAVERTTGKVPSEFALHFLGESQDNPRDFQKSFDVTRATRDNVLAILGETAERIVSRDFAPIAEEERLKRCSLCEFREVCPYKIQKKAA